MDGNEATAWAALRAGCSFFAGYPITPATGILQTLIRLLPPKGGVCLQAEDEISALGLCIGASMAGKKAMTATSGPGISLCAEQIAFAIAGEIPLVIVDVQRLGPSTGSATRGADGDIGFLRWAFGSGLPIIALCPQDVKDSFYLTYQAFNWAERFRCPVFVASNKEAALTRESICLDETLLPACENRAAPPADEIFQPFATTPQRLVPYFLPMGAKTSVRQTSSTHGPNGYIVTDPTVIEKNIQRLSEKIQSASEQLALYEYLATPGARRLIIAYGVTGRAARQAFETLKRSNAPTSLLILKTLWPVPEKLIQDMAAPFERILVVEMNLGQYVREIRRILPQSNVSFFGQMNGELITPTQIVEAAVHG